MLRFFESSKQTHFSGPLSQSQDFHLCATEPVKDFNHYKNANKVFWVMEDNLLDIFKRYDKVPCIYVEKFKNGTYGIIELDPSIAFDPYQYTAWRKLIGQDYDFRADVLLIDKSKDKLYNTQGKEIAFDSLTRSPRFIDKKYLGRMARMTAEINEKDSRNARTSNYHTSVVSSLQIVESVWDFNHFKNTNKVFWIIADDQVGNFKRYDKIPCIYVEKFKDDTYGIIELDPSIADDPFQYTAWRKLIGEEHDFIAEVLLIDKSTDKLYNMQGKEIAFGSLTRSPRLIDKSYLAPIARINPR